MLVRHQVSFYYFVIANIKKHMILFHDICWNGSIHAKYYLMEELYELRRVFGVCKGEYIRVFEF